MNKQTAEEKKLNYTGIYERSKEELMSRLKEFRDKGYKAYIVTIPDSPYSRSSYRGKGYAIYVDNQYVLDEKADRMRGQIDMYPHLLKIAKSQYDVKVAELEQQYNNCLTWLKENGYK